MPETLVYLIILVPTFLLLIQSVISLYQTLYIWDDPDRILKSGAPKKYEKPEHGFSVLLPARHEAEVIGHTLINLSRANYPKSRLELLVICTEDDTETIKAAKSAIRAHKIRNAKVVTFGGEPGKSKGMNIGVGVAKHNIITIFDSEDDVSPDIFHIANSLMLKKGYDVLQCGVQLMDFRSKWFSAHNVLEYFFWFKSRMHYYARINSVPLGGNTVFFKKSDLEEVGGWDEHGLTEDADIGIRLSARGKKFGAMYDARHVTKEECPHSVASFIKQRTRWNQGFLQIIKKNEWKRLPKVKQLLLVMYVLTAPSYMAIVIFSAPVLITLGLITKLSVIVSLLTFIPVLLMLVALTVNLIGLHEFGRDQKLKIRMWDYLRLILTFIPYQIMLVVSALRALTRELKGNRGWEKTAHFGTHRTRTSPNTEGAL